MIRGGSWNNNANNCRTAKRNNNNPDNNNNNGGVRSVLPPAQPARRKARRLTRLPSCPVGRKARWQTADKHPPGESSLAGLAGPKSPGGSPNVKTDGFRVVVQGEAGKRYDIEATETPGVPTSWVAVATNLDGAGLVDFTDTLATSRQARFYRVIER